MVRTQSAHPPGSSSNAPSSSKFSSNSINRGEGGLEANGREGRDALSREVLPTVRRAVRGGAIGHPDRHASVQETFPQSRCPSYARGSCGRNPGSFRHSLQSSRVGSGLCSMLKQTLRPKNRTQRPGCSVDLPVSSHTEFSGNCCRVRPVNHPTDSLLIGFSSTSGATDGPCCIICLRRPTQASAPQTQSARLEHCQSPASCGKRSRPAAKSRPSHTFTRPPRAPGSAQVRRARMGRAARSWVTIH